MLTLSLSDASGLVPSGGALFKCNGASVNALANPSLYGIMGHQFGGSGTTFQVPNFNNILPVLP